MLVQNLHARELISARKTSHKVEDVLLVEFMYLVFTRMPGVCYRRRLRSLLLCLCDIFRRALINFLYAESVNCRFAKSIKSMESGRNNLRSHTFGRGA